jgi:two-component system, OmpR family, KDP operon response regulator KdpE
VRVVLVVEDDPAIRRFLRATLTVQGYEMVEAATVRDGLMHATAHNPDLLLVDIGLPDGDGADLVRQVRSWSTTPIIILSARSAEADKVRGLDAGADDYLTKPFGVGELIARMRAALRRRTRDPANASATVVTVGPLTVDHERRQVLMSGREVHLTPNEYKLLAALLRHAGKVVTQEQLLCEVWGPDRAEAAHYLRIYVHQLRQKLEEDPARPRWLLTEPGVGYRVRDE